MDGVLVVDKPEGLTSHDVVAAARRILGEKRIGHTGTLDPLATGVLPLACGRATRLVRFLTASDKDYDATIRFGLTTDSYDITGEETSRSAVRPTRERLDEALASLRGDYLQMPPAYSAKKVAGRRAYDLARNDEPVTLTAVPVSVTRAEVLAFDGDRVRIELTCSAGFYVRALAHSLGQLVGAGACLETLRRTRSGDFGLEAAITLDALAEEDDGGAGFLIPMEELLPRMPGIRVTDEGLQRVSHGRELEARHLIGAIDARADLAIQPYTRLLDADGHLLALATSGGTPGSLHPSVVLI